METRGTLWRNRHANDAVERVRYEIKQAENLLYLQYDYIEPADNTYWMEDSSAVELNLVLDKALPHFGASNVEQLLAILKVQTEPFYRFYDYALQSGLVADAWAGDAMDVLSR